MPNDTEMYMPEAVEMEAPPPAEQMQADASTEPPEPVAETPATNDAPADKPAASSNSVVLSSALEIYRQLVAQLDASKQTINARRHELAEIRQRIRELSTEAQREPRLEDETSSHDLHTSKVAVQHDDCGSIISYAEQVRRSIYDNAAQAEELISPMAQSVELLKLRVRHVRLLEELLAAQESGLRLEIQQRNADACIWQLADILKV